MPNGSFLNQPLMPQSWVDAAQQAAQPGLNTSPTMARLKGFGAGALEGLRNLSTPMNIGSTAAMAIPGVGEAAMAEEAPAAILGLSKALPQAGAEVARSIPAIPGVSAYSATEDMEAVHRAYMASQAAAREALMGTPQNIPNNPVAQALEAARMAAAKGK